MKLKRRGSLRDVLFITVIIFALVLTSIVGIKFMQQLDDALQSQDGISEEAKNVSSTVRTRLPKWVDGAFILIWSFMMVFGFILAINIQSNPVFLPVSIIYFIFLIFISQVFSTVYENMVAIDSLSGTVTTMTFIPFMMPKLPLFSFIIGIMIVGFMVINR